MRYDKNIIIIEDNANEALLAERFLIKINPDFQISVSGDGQKAIDYLRNCGVPETNNVLPDLILLDLRLPVVDGFEVLRLLRQDINLKHIRVIVFTGFLEDEEILTCYRLGANAFVTKPLTLEKVSEAAKELQISWLFKALGAEVLIGPGG
jgi:two-component system, response regulator